MSLLNMWQPQDLPRHLNGPRRQIDSTMSTGKKDTSEKPEEENHSCQKTTPGEVNLQTS